MKTWNEYVALWEAIADYATVCGGDVGEKTSNDPRMAAVVNVNIALAQYAGFDHPSHPKEWGDSDDVHGQAEHHESLHEKEPSA